ncbi:hypothetical protein KP509_06G014700 [Ceratopteris richardii]|uniref:Pentatricopeptide repeat-containing protein n=1 Tax=Ceratopteris richardii TaxID=49495 RepID=A0A8T2UQ74_CERRI|nr:hypothetical protein KP509_06G014700 [Ceratopteris richardii]
MYAKCGMLDRAQTLFDSLTVHDVISWNALLAGYSHNGYGHKALSCFEQMQSEGFHPDAVTFTCSLKACGIVGDGDKGTAIHDRVRKLGLIENNIILGNALVDMYAKCGLLQDAHKTLKGLRVKDIVSWNALIAGYAEHGPAQEVLACLEQMELEKISLDAISFVYVLKACGNAGAIDQGQELHAEIARRGLENDSHIGSTLIDMYAKCGLAMDAILVFNNLPVQDVVSWNAIIKGCGMNHNGKKAVEYFEGMQKQGLKPDAVTFPCLLSACSHAKLVAKGKEMFELMPTVHGIRPSLDHYNCMIDILSRAGRIKEALRFIESMPCLPSIDMWTAILSACKEHDLAEDVLGCYTDMQLDGVIQDVVSVVYALKACDMEMAIHKGTLIHTEIEKQWTA